MCDILGYADDPSRRTGNHLEQKEKLGLTSAAKGRSNALTTPSEPTDAFQKVEVRISFYQLSNDVLVFKYNMKQIYSILLEVHKEPNERVEPDQTSLIEVDLFLRHHLFDLALVQ